MGKVKAWRVEEEEELIFLGEEGRNVSRCLGSWNPPLGTLCVNYPCTNLSQWYQFVNGKYGELGKGKVKINNLILVEGGLMLRGFFSPLLHFMYLRLF